MSKYTSQLEAALRRAGWFPGRKVETWRYEGDYEAAHSTLPGFARQFLAEFGHLKLLADLNPGQDKSFEQDIYFNTALGVSSFGEDLLAMFEKAAGQKATPVGEFNDLRTDWYHFSYCVVLLGEQGAFYKSIIDLDDLVLVGDDFNDLFEYQCGRRAGRILID